MRRKMNTPAAIAGLLLLLTSLTLAGCAAPSPARTTTRPPSRPAAPPGGPAQTLPPQGPAAPAAPPFTGLRPPAERDAPARPEQTPRRVASLHLTEQAQRLLERGNADEAIRTLERAVNLNPSQGENFYYLAEAWLLKNNLPQAGTFNRLAEQHLQQDAAWMARVAEQAARIKRNERGKNEEKRDRHPGHGHRLPGDGPALLGLYDDHHGQGRLGRRVGDGLPFR